MNRAVQQVAGRGKTVRLGNNAMIMNVPNYQPALRRATPQEVNYVDLAGTQNMHTTDLFNFLLQFLKALVFLKELEKELIISL